MVAAVTLKLSTGGCASRARAPFSIEKGLTGRVGSGKPNRRPDSRQESRRDARRVTLEIPVITRIWLAPGENEVIHRSRAVPAKSGLTADISRDLVVTPAVRHTVTDHG